MRHLCLLFIFTFPLLGYSSSVSYGGMTMECKWGCGDTESEHMLKIEKIFHSTVQEAFKNCHPYYEDLRRRGRNPSIFVHFDRERLLREYAGTGVKTAGDMPGMPGYIEIVDFKEFIGYAVDQKTGEKLATTWGKIHYAHDGVHIVPTRPRGK